MTRTRASAISPAPSTPTALTPTLSTPTSSTPSPSDHHHPTNVGTHRHDPAPSAPSPPQNSYAHHIPQPNHRLLRAQQTDAHARALQALWTQRWRREGLAAMAWMEEELAPPTERPTESLTWQQEELLRREETAAAHRRLGPGHCRSCGEGAAGASTRTRRRRGRGRGAAVETEPAAAKVTAAEQTPAPRRRRGRRRRRTRARSRRPGSSAEQLGSFGGIWEMAWGDEDLADACGAWCFIVLAVLIFLYASW